MSSEHPQSELPIDLAPQSSGGTKRKRSRTGCLTCRARKVKCDETPGTCQKCFHLSLICKWAEKTQYTGRQRRSTAKKQSFGPGPSPGSTTDEATGPRAPGYLNPSELHAGQSIHNTHNAERPSTTSTLGPTAMISTGLRIDDDTLHQCLASFFELVYPTQGMSFIHRGQLYQAVSAGNAPPLLLKAMCTVAFRFTRFGDSSNVDGGKLAADWANEVKYALVEKTDRLSLHKLAAILCLIQHEFNSGRLISATTYVAMASRILFTLNLQHEALKLDIPIAKRETRRRLAWATYCADCLFSGGVKSYVTCDSSSMEICLPCGERKFNLSLDTDPIKSQDVYPPVFSPQLPDLISTAKFSLDGDALMAFWVWIMQIRADILDVTKRFPSLDPPVWHPHSVINTLGRRLAIWKESLPRELQWSLATLYTYHRQPEFGTFVTIHVLHDQLQSACLRPTLAGELDTIPTGYWDAAPPGWLEKTQGTAFAWSKAMWDKVLTLESHFPEWIPPTRMWNLLLSGIVRSVLAYTSASSPQYTVSPELERMKQESLPDRAEITTILQTCLNVVSKMTDYFHADRHVYRDLNRMARYHGYFLSDTLEHTGGTTTGARTPRNGLLPNLPYMNRYVRHPPLEDELEQSEVNKMTAELIDASPTASNATTTIHQDIPRTVINPNMVSAQTRTTTYDQPVGTQNTLYDVPPLTSTSMVSTKDPMQLDMSTLPPMGQTDGFEAHLGLDGLTDAETLDIWNSCFGPDQLNDDLVGTFLEWPATSVPYMGV